MNPELLRATRMLLRQLDVAEKTGVDFGPEKQEQFIRQATGGKFGAADAFQIAQSQDTSLSLRNLGRSAIQGAAFEYGDELLGVLPEALGGGEAAKEEMRLRQEMFRDEHPVADFAAGVGAGLVVPGGLGAAAARRAGAGLAARAATGMAAGGSAGFVAGTGSGEGMEDRLSRGRTGAVLGGALGLGLPVGAAGVRAVADPALRASRRVRGAIDASGGVEAVRGLNRAAEASGRGDEAMLGTLSDELGAQLDWAANADPATFMRTRAAARGQRTEMATRVLEDVATRVETPAAQQRLTELQLARREWASEAYGQLREKHRVIFDSEGLKNDLGGMLREKNVRKAWEEARETQLIGPFPEVATPSFEMVQEAVFKLESAGNRAQRAGDYNMAARLREAAKTVRLRLREAVPGYREVDAEYAQRLGLEDALVSGEEWFNRRGRLANFRRDFDSLTPAQKDEFRRGLVSKLVEQLENASHRQNVANDLMQRSKLLDAKLKTIFENPEHFDSFIANIEQEAALLRRAEQASGGSPTARRQMEEGADPLEAAGDVANVATVGATAAAGALARSMARRAPRAMARASARRAGPILTTKGSEAIEQLLRSMQARPDALTVGATAAGRLPAGLSSAFRYGDQ
jgi:hypothetical protein